MTLLELIVLGIEASPDWSLGTSAIMGIPKESSIGSFVVLSVFRAKLIYSKLTNLSNVKNVLCS